MTVTVTLPAPPEQYLETGLLPATRPRVVAIGSGLAGLTATKALKRDLVTITDALMFLTRLTAQGTAHVHHRTVLWLQAIPSAAAALTAMGALIALYIAVVRGRKRAPHERRNHRAQLDALYSAGSQGYEIVSTAGYFSCDRHQRPSRRTRKGWR